MSLPQKKALVKLNDLASDAEVSIATVSLALRNDPSISESTRRRVLEAKKRLGYSPIRRRTPTIPAGSDNGTSGCKSILYCVVNFPVKKIHYADFLVGVMDACQKKKIRLELKTIQASDIEPGSTWVHGGTDGIILTGDLQQNVVDHFLQSNPHTLILGNYSFSHVHRVELDVFGMGEMVAQRLMEDGHRQIAHVLRDPKNYYERQFLMGLRDGLEVHGLELPSSHVVPLSNLQDSLTEVVDRISAMAPPITAITADASNVAEACLAEMRYLQATNGREMPTAYTVSMVSNERAALPGLHILDMGLQRCGCLAVERLCDIHANPPAFPYASVVHSLGWQSTEPVR